MAEIATSSDPWAAFPTARQYVSGPPSAPAATTPWDAFPSADQYANQTIGPGDKLPPVVEDASKMASIPTQVAASLPTDEMAKVDYFASKRFPALSQAAARDRYFWKDNRLAYKADDGNAYYEEPTATPPTSVNDAVQDVKAVASLTGPAIPATAGAIGGVLTSGTAGGVPGAAAFAVGGDAIRQGLAHLITGEEKSWGDRAWQAGKSGAEMGVGQLLGHGLTKVIPGKTPTFDIPAATNVGDAARKFDIPLTAGEETGNRTLLRRQKILANTTDADVTFENFYRGRNEKVGQAVNSLLTSISPTGTSPRIASGMAVEGAQAAVKGARAEMQAQAKPIYEVALQPGNIVELPAIQKNLDPAEQAILKHVTNTIRNDPVLGPKIQGWQDNAMFTLDQVKKNTDSMISAAQQAGDGYRASILTGFKNNLLKTMDQAHPEYANARAIYEEGMPAATNIERGVVGDMAKLENNDVLRASQTIFGKGSSPEDIRAARAAFEAAGKKGALPNWQDNWNALVRSHLEQTFNEIPESSTGAVTNVGGTFYKAVYGNTRKKAMLEAATEHNPGLQADMLDLMTALNATGRAMKGESITAFAQMGQKELANEAKGFIPKAIETIEVWRTPSRFANYIADIQAGKYNARMAELLTTPEGRQKLKELRKLGPGSAGAVVGLSQLLTAGGVGAVSNLLNRNPDGPVSNPGYQAPETPAPQEGPPAPTDQPPSLLSDEQRGAR